MTTPAFVQQTFRSLNEEITDKEAKEFVNKLVKSGYKKIKVDSDKVIHVYDDGSNSLEFVTIVVASLTGKIDIGAK